MEESDIRLKSCIILRKMCFFLKFLRVCGGIVMFLEELRMVCIVFREMVDIYKEKNFKEFFFFLIWILNKNGIISCFLEKMLI